MPPVEAMEGIASWYGEEFAGRTTANGEIFDPTLLTAAHRTFPFGTILDVTNPQTTQTVRVRVNDRGPYIGNRMIDLSYAAAQKIGLIEPGVGRVDIKVVRVGSGEREPPAPFDVTIAESPKTAPPVVAPGDAPAVEFPLPQVARSTSPAPVVAPVVTPPAIAPVAPPPATTAPVVAAARPSDSPVADIPAVAAAPTPVVVDRIEVQTQRGDVITRKQVGSSGKLEDVPIGRGEATTASSYDEQRRTAAVKRAAKTKQFVVQVGAFAIENNAKLLQQRLTAIGMRAFIDRDGLFRVRIGPFATRDKALETRTTLESNGISAMILAE
jgi:rare lipoprotein A